MQVAARTAWYKGLPPNQLPAAPDAKFFPGLPPAGTKALDAARVKIKGTTADSYWQGLGLWAMAGQPVTVTIPQALLRALPVGSAPITLHIGGWTDNIYKDRAEFTRLPEMVRFYTVSSARTVIGSAFGGLIYITLPEGLKLADQTITVTGAIKAPVMTEGMTAKQWAAVLAASPAPWGEVVTSKLVISTPRSSLATVTDPVKLTKYWNAVMDSHAWMAGINANRPSPMSIQHDQDIEFGYMHSGYHIMTFMDVVNSTLDTSGAHWGHYHELGHNHQDSAWTWECVVEVTCNFFSARGMAAVRGFTDPAHFYGWYDGNMEQRLQDQEKYFADGPDHKVLCDSPSLYLDSFLQLIEDGGYGFELLRDTIASYKNLSEEEMPQTDEEKIQTWVKQQSKTAGCNFYEHYQQWGWPLLEAAKAALSARPVAEYPGCGNYDDYNN